MIAYRHMKKVTLYSTSRDHFLFIAQALGQILHANQTQKPWMIDLTGDINAGKAALMLGVDSAYRPEKYPNGVEKTFDIKAEISKSITRPVIYEDDGDSTTPMRKKEYDDILRSLQRVNTAARVIFL